MQTLINEMTGLRCVASTAFLDEVAPLIAQHQAQVAVLDIQLRGGSTMKLLPSLCKDFPSTRFVIQSGHSNPGLIRSAYAAGAHAYVLKSGDIDDLNAAIRGLIRS